MYMSRHQELFEGHTTRNGKSVELDEEAIKILEEQYPLPEMVQIIRDPELEKERVDSSTAEPYHDRE